MNLKMSTNTKFHTQFKAVSASPLVIDFPYFSSSGLTYLSQNLMKLLLSQIPSIGKISESAHLTSLGSIPHLPDSTTKHSHPLISMQMPYSLDLVLTITLSAIVTIMEANASVASLRASVRRPSLSETSLSIERRSLMDRYKLIAVPNKVS